MSNGNTCKKTGAYISLNKKNINNRKTGKTNNSSNLQEAVL
jgi:hypothetical protein